MQTVKMHRSTVFYVCVLSFFFICLWNQIHTYYEIRRKRGDNIQEIPDKRNLKKRHSIDDPCLFYGSCSFNKEKTVQNCMCDGKCHMYNDCCFDADLDAMEKIHDNDTLHLTKMAEYITCRASQYQQDQSVEGGYQMVNTCPAGFQNLTIKRLCEFNGKKDLPVTGKRNNIVYWNEFCALCHNEEFTSPWELHINAKQCNIPQNRLLLLSANISHLLQTVLVEGCPYLFLPPLDKDFTPRSCLNFVDPNENARCNEYVNPVLACVKSICNVYRNHYCISDIKEARIICLQSTDNLKLWKAYPLTAVFNFDTRAENTHLDTCGDMADDHTGICKNSISSSKVEELSMKNTMVGAEYWTEFDQRLDKRFGLRLVKAFSHTCIHFVGLKQTRAELYEKCIEHLQSREIYCGTVALIEMKINRKLSVDSLSFLAKGLQNISWSYSETRKDSPKQTIIYFKSLPKHSYKILNFTKLREYPPGFYSEKMPLGVIENDSLFHNFKSFFDVCNISAEIDKDGKFLNTSATFLGGGEVTNRLLNKDENTIKSAQSMEQMRSLDSLMKIILTYLTLILSILFLVGTLLAMKYLNIESNTSSCMTMHIIVILLLAHVLFLFGSGMTDFPTLCIVIGVLSHYSWLSFFLWINIFVTYITLKLKSIWKFLGPDKSGSDFVEDRFRKYNYKIGYCIPLLIVIPAAILGNLEIENIQLVDTAKACFPNTYPLNLLVFAIPVFISIIYNIICLCISCINIHKLRKVKVHRSIHTSRSYLSMFIKLCSISGISWCIGILAELFDSTVLDYIFIISSGLHGFIISICFISSEQIKSAIKKKFKGKEEVIEVSIIPQEGALSTTSDRVHSGDINSMSLKDLSDQSTVYVSAYVQITVACNKHSTKGHVRYCPESERFIAGNDQQTAELEHFSAGNNQQAPELERFIARNDQKTAESEHYIDGNDQPTAESLHFIGRNDQQTADSEHSIACYDQRTAESLHFIACYDQQIAESQHFIAGNDQQTAESEHFIARNYQQTAESQHYIACNEQLSEPQFVTFYPISKPENTANTEQTVHELRQITMVSQHLFSGQNAVKETTAFHYVPRRNKVLTNNGNMFLNSNDEELSRKYTEVEMHLPGTQMDKVDSSQIYDMTLDGNESYKIIVDMKENISYKNKVTFHIL